MIRTRSPWAPAPSKQGNVRPRPRKTDRIQIRMLCDGFGQLSASVQYQNLWTLCWRYPIGAQASRREVVRRIVTPRSQSREGNQPFSNLDWYFLIPNRAVTGSRKGWHFERWMLFPHPGPTPEIIIILGTCAGPKLAAVRLHGTAMARIWKPWKILEMSHNPWRSSKLEPTK